MKTLVFANQKGGVGKSALAVQYAYFLALQENKRVLVIDFDHQQNTTSAMKRGGFATISDTTSSSIFKTKGASVDIAPFLLVPGDRDLINLEKGHLDENSIEQLLVASKDNQANFAATLRSIFKNSHNTYATNLNIFLASVNDDFDVCIIDTNPNPDIRQLASLVVTDYVVSPLQMNQEAIDGISDLLKNDRIGLLEIKAKLNKKLDFIGIIPNLVEPKPTQKANLLAICDKYPELLIKMDKGFAIIKMTTAIPEAQAVGIPIWHIKKTSARNAWALIMPIFQRISSYMEV